MPLSQPLCCALWNTFCGMCLEVVLSLFDVTSERAGPRPQRRKIFQKVLNQKTRNEPCGVRQEVVSASLPIPELPLWAERPQHQASTWPKGRHVGILPFSKGLAAMNHNIQTIPRSPPYASWDILLCFATPFLPHFEEKRPRMPHLPVSSCFSIPGSACIVKLDRGPGQAHPLPPT